MANPDKQSAERLRVQVENTLTRIATENDANSLKRLYANIQRHEELGDRDRERLTEATILRLRVVSPALATRVGGAKDAAGRDFLQNLHERAAAELDLSGNTLGQGVKTGGYMINGTRFVDVYLSYKTAEGKNLSLAWVQQDATSKPYLHLLLRHVGKSRAGDILDKSFSDPDKAIDRYLRELEGLLGSPQPSKSLIESR